MKKHIKLYGIITIGVLLVVYGIYSFLKPMKIETKIIVPSRSEVSFIETGSVVNSGEHYIYPLVAGKLEQINVKAGDFVKAGEVLAQLDHGIVDFEVVQLEKAVEAYQAQLAMAEIEYQNNHDTLKANKSNLEGQLKALKAETGSTSQRELEELVVTQSQSIYERGLEDLEKYKQLYDIGSISEAELKDYQMLVDTYKRNYDQSLIASESGGNYYEGMKNSINAQINSIAETLIRDSLSTTKAYYQSMIDSSKATLEAAKIQASYLDITTSVDGVVNEIMIENMNIVSGLEPAFIVQGEGENKIKVKVNTRDIDVIHTGDKVELIMDTRTGDQVTEGTISFISTSASIEISPLGVEERRVQVIIEPAENGTFSAGFDVDVKFIVYNEGNKLIVPNSALFKKDGYDMILLIREGIVKEVEVELGYELTGETVIESGLTEGDQLVTDLDAKGLSVGTRATSSNE